MPVPPSKPQVRRAVPLACVALILAVFAAYADGLRGPFIFDDLHAIPLNPTLRSLGSAFSPPSGGFTVSGRPVLNASFALNWLISGPGVLGFHLVNVTIHALAGLVLFGIIRRTLIRLGRGAEEAFWPAFLIALLWLVHPLQTESVTYVAQRAESLMGLFYLLTLYAFIRGAEVEKASGWFVASVIACFLGVGTKEVIASAPLVVLVYDRAFVAGGFSEAWRRRRGVYLGLFSSWLPLAILVAANDGRGSTLGSGSHVGFLHYLATQFQAVCHYLWLTVWPDPLILDYGKHWVSSAMEVVPYALVVLVLVGGTLWALIRRPALGFLGLCFFALLAPTSLVPGGRQTLAEHRMYLALAPVLVLVVLGLERCLGRWSRWILAGAALAMACVTVARNADYATDLGIWADTVAKRPGNAYAQNNYANLLSQSGHPDLALQHLDAALATDPGYTDAAFDAGNALLRLGRPAEAAARFEQALRYNPRMADAHTQLGVALEAIGRSSEAIGHFEAAIQIDPESRDARNGLGMALAKDGRFPEAIAQYEAALRIDPHSAALHNNFGNAYRAMGRLNEALAQFDLAAAEQPDSAEICANRGLTLLMLERLPEAISSLQAALKLNPNLGQVHLNLAVALGRSGREAQADAELEIARRLGAVLEGGN